MLTNKMIMLTLIHDHRKIHLIIIILLTITINYYLFPFTGGVVLLNDVLCTRKMFF